MNAKFSMIISLVFVGAMLGCGQEAIVLPDASCPGACGPDYSSGPYGNKDGDTIECFEWTVNVRKGSYESNDDTSDPDAGLDGGVVTESLHLGDLKAQYNSGEFDAIRAQFGFSKGDIDPSYLVFINVAKS